MEENNYTVKVFTRTGELVKYVDVYAPSLSTVFYAAAAADSAIRGVSNKKESK